MGNFNKNWQPRQNNNEAPRTEPITLVKEECPKCEESNSTTSKTGVFFAGAAVGTIATLAVPKLWGLGKKGVGRIKKLLGGSKEEVVEVLEDEEK